LDWKKGFMEAVKGCGERDESLGGFIVNREHLLPDVRRLSKVNNLKAAFSVARQWLVIAIAMGFAVWFREWWVWVAAGIVIATRQHALAIIMHDATHYRLFTNRAANEWASDFLCAYPIGLSTQLYRKQHLEHHQFTNTDRDPYWSQMKQQEDWNWPKAQVECIKMFLKDVLGLNILKMFLFLTLWSPWPRLANLKAPWISDNQLTEVEKNRWLLFAIVVAAAIQLTHSWIPFFLLWVLPALTFLGALMRIRGVAEHLVLEATHELNSTRHVDATWLERLSISPLNINYHLAHHMFPSVPQYHLPELHRILSGDRTFREHATCVKKYLGFRESVLSLMIRQPAQVAG
jgi:fatty acid desaturase